MKQDFFRNKKAIVTGASTGIGQSIALELAQVQSYTFLLGRNTSRLRDTLRKIKSFNANGEIVKLNLKKQKEIIDFTSKLTKNNTQIDFLINAAGVWHDQKEAYYDKQLMQTPVTQINEVLDVGIRAPFLLTKLVLPLMSKGKIINISGTFSNSGAGWLHYFVSKKAIEQFTKGLAAEYKGFNINCISPSDTATPAYKKFFPKYAKNALKPKDVAELALFLLSKKAKHISGEIVTIKKS